MSSDLAIDNEYKRWLTEVKTAILQTQIKAALRVNVELLQLYWQLGAMIVEKQQASTWGNGLLDQLSRDLRSEFPDLQGFSRTNLAYIRRWFLFYQSESAIVPQAVAQLDIPEHDEILQIPWDHNREIISKCQSLSEALYYVRNTLQHNWSRAVLVHQIESMLYSSPEKFCPIAGRGDVVRNFSGQVYQRAGKALSNFEHTLPKPQSDLAQQTLKDPYIFDFLHLTQEYTERDLEDVLVEHVTKFLLELGAGFSFISRQYHLEIGGQDFYIDLLFYHVRLHCYVVLELKVTAFQPEYAGKLNFYLSAVDDQLRDALDQPTIGILICKDKNKTVAEYALRDIHKPIGVSEHQLTQSLPDDLKSSLPSIEEIERELTSLDEDGADSVASVEG